jgi:zinc protease
LAGSRPDEGSLIEEIQRLHEDDPYRNSSLYFDQLLYSDFAYSHPAVGSSISDINNITVKDVTEFYSRYYTPDHAVLSIAGNIDINKTVQLIRKYFGSIPAGNFQIPSSPEKPPITETAEETIDDPLASYPGFYLGYRLGPPSSDDFYSLSLIEYLLFRGKSSRLHNRLLNERERIAFQLQGGIETREDFAVLKIFVLANEEVMQDRCRRAVFSEINRMCSNPVSERELERAKNLFKADYLKRLDTTLGKAIFLAENYFEKKSLDEIFDKLTRYMQIPSTRITGVMNRYFSEGSILLNIRVR